jgi:hypothetical protein
MPRRVIYIKNPKSGSNFRTINADKKSGGSGGSLFERLGLNQLGKKPKPFKPNGPGTQYTPGTAQLTGGAYYKTPGSNWFSGGWAAAMDVTPGYGNFGTPSGAQVGPYDTNFPQPPPGYGGARPLKGWELFIALMITSAGAAAATPEMFAPAIAGAYEAQGVGASYGAAAYFQAQLVAYGSKGAMATIDAAALAGVEFSVNDAPTVRWNDQEGSYTTEYHDLISAVFKDKDYRQKKWKP